MARARPTPGCPGELPPGRGQGEEETQFLHDADTVFLATVNADGWHYVQHSGGPRGFLRVLSPAHIAFADYRGRQSVPSPLAATHSHSIVAGGEEEAGAIRRCVHARITAPTIPIDRQFDSNYHDEDSQSTTD